MFKDSWKYAAAVMLGLAGFNFILGPLVTWGIKKIQGLLPKEG